MDDECVRERKSRNSCNRTLKDRLLRISCIPVDLHMFEKTNQQSGGANNQDVP